MKQLVRLIIFRGSKILESGKPAFSGLFLSCFGCCLLVLLLHIFLVVFDKVNTVDLPLRVNSVVALQFLAMADLTELLERVNSFFVVIVHTVLGVPFRDPMELKQISKLH